jgi:hypothetical protein
MASSHSSATANELENYTAMKGDVEALGAHCQMEYCHVLDFLPFKCGSCERYIPLVLHEMNHLEAF